MRKLRFSVVGATITSLMLLSIAGAAAQSDGVTGTLEFTGQPQARTAQVHDWVADDVRLSGEAIQSEDWNLYAAPSEDVGQSGQATYEINNDGGTWRCVATSPDGPEPEIDTHSMVFQGLGGYDGLTAHVRIDWSAYPFTFSGVILSGGAPSDPTLVG